MLGAFHLTQHINPYTEKIQFRVPHIQHTSFIFIVKSQPLQMRSVCHFSQPQIVNGNRVKFHSHFINFTAINIPNKAAIFHTVAKDMELVAPRTAMTGSHSQKL